MMQTCKVSPLSWVWARISSNHLGLGFRTGVSSGHELNQQSDKPRCIHGSNRQRDGPLSLANDRGRRKHYRFVDLAALDQLGEIWGLLVLEQLRQLCLHGFPQGQLLWILAFERPIPTRQRRRLCALFLDSHGAHQSACS